MSTCKDDACQMCRKDDDTAPLFKKGRVTHVNPLQSLAGVIDTTRVQAQPLLDVQSQFVQQKKRVIEDAVKHSILSLSCASMLMMTGEQIMRRQAEHVRHAVTVLDQSYGLC